MPIVISVIVCTYNRAELLKGCLASLVCQTAPGGTFEVIVVDNNSSDNTGSVVKAYLERANFRYVTESNPGLSHARNRGAAEARADHIAFLDDDALANADWLEVACHLLETMTPSPDCLGGPIYPFYTSPKPDWFKDEYEKRRDWAEARYLRRGESFSGSNMIWKRDALEAIGGFDVTVGIRENTLSLGEDTAAFNKCWDVIREPALFYSPALIVRHWVPDFKMSVSYRLKRNFAVGLFLARENRHNLRKLQRIVLNTKEVAKIVFLMLLRFPRYRRWQNWIIDESSYGFLPLGELLGLLGINPLLSQE